MGTANWVVQLLSQSTCYCSVEELGALDFYAALFSNSQAFMRYGYDMEIPITYSEEGDGTWRSEKLSVIPSVVDNRNDAYISACTYFPKRINRHDGSFRWVSTNSKETAQELCAFVLDIDRCSVIAFKNYLEYIWPAGGIPQPTYLVASGNGVHLYYVLDWPVEMKKRWLEELKHIQSWLGSLYTGRNPSFALLAGFDSPDLKDLQIEDIGSKLGDYDCLGLTQSYRVVGSLTKDESDVVTAWRIGETWDIEDLGRLAGLTQSFDIETFDMSKSMKTQQIEEWKARKAERESESGDEKRKGKKGHNPFFYPWFVETAKSHAPWPQYVGGRYNTILCMVLAARKDNYSPRQNHEITRDQIEKDARDLFEIWNAVAVRDNLPSITWSEVKKAIRCGYRFNHNLVRIKKNWIADKCKWEIVSHQKRNGRNQDVHLKVLASQVRNLEYPDGSWRYHGGAPTKESIVLDYAREHPGANHSQISRATGVSRPTVIKWLKKTEGEVS